MKLTKPLCLLTFSLSAAVAIALCAEDQPQNSKPNPTATAKADTPYLGVVVEMPNNRLSEHLKIPVGFGLPVQTVLNKSPVENDLIPGDVLFKFNDQMLASNVQLMMLIRACKPGDEVKLVYFRNGEEKTATVKLTTIPADLETSRSGTSSIKMHLGDELFDFDLGKNQPMVGRQFFGSPQISTSAQVVRVDGDTCYEMNMQNDKKHLKITKDGKSVFDGPINTPEECEKIPEIYREDALKLKNDNGVTIFFGNTPSIDVPDMGLESLDKLIDKEMLTPLQEMRQRHKELMREMRENFRRGGNDFTDFPDDPSNRWLNDQIVDSPITK